MAGCWWLAIVMPDLYWGGTVFTVSDDAEPGVWVADARRGGVRLVCHAEMDSCELTLGDQMATGRTINRGGVKATCFAHIEDANFGGLVNLGYRVLGKSRGCPNVGPTCRGARELRKSIRSQVSEIWPMVLGAGL